MAKSSEYRGYRIVRYERPSKNWRYGNLKFWTTEPPLHPPPADAIEAMLTRSGGVIYRQTRAEMKETIDLHLDGPQPRNGYTATCPGCARPAAIAS